MSFDEVTVEHEFPREIDPDVAESYEEWPLRTPWDLDERRITEDDLTDTEVGHASE